MTPSHSAPPHSAPSHSAPSSQPPSSQPPSRDVFARARDGDAAATAALTEWLRPRLTGMARHYARRSHEDPDDLLQEAWIGLLEALRELNLDIGSPEQYLIRHARWRLLDAIRRARVRRCASLEPDALESAAFDGAAFNGAAFGHTAFNGAVFEQDAANEAQSGAAQGGYMASGIPPCGIAALEITDCTDDFAAGLKATQRAVLRCLLAGLTWREAGCALGCTSANIAYHVRQIRCRYQQWSADEGHDIRGGT